MGFIDKIKQFFREEEIKETAKLKFADISEFVNKEQKELESRKQEYLNPIQQKLSELITELKNEKKELEKIDLEKKKEQEKIKLVVQENLYYYIAYLEQLIENLESSNVRDIEKIESIIFEFNKKSNGSYEKATFLIGKELGKVKESIRKFIRDTRESNNKYRECLEQEIILNSIKKKLSQFNRQEEIKQDLNKAIENLNMEIGSMAGKKESIEKEIEKIKDSEEYKETLRKKQEILEKKKEIEEEIYNLKQLIDFKSLAETFHVNEKKMNLVKMYKEDFMQNFMKNNAGIIELLDEAKLNVDEIGFKIKKIESRNKEISDVTPGSDATENLVLEIEKLKHVTEKIKENKENEEKKFVKIDCKKKEIYDYIKKEIEKIGAELVE